MSDLFTIMWKEWKDSLFQGGWKAWIRPGILIGILGVAWPLVGKTAWMALSPLQMVVVLWVAFFVIIDFCAADTHPVNGIGRSRTLLSSAGFV